MMKSNLYSNNRSFSQYEREWNEPSRSIAVRKQSYALFNKTLIHGCLRRFFSILIRKSCELLSLSSILRSGSAENSVEIGIVTVPINKVIGSENRCKDFDKFFVPMSERNHQRWLRISDMFLLGETIPAIELIQIGHLYFVGDGHHRLSVAKALGRAFIDAKVTVYQVSEESLIINKHHFAINKLSTANFRTI